MKRASNAMKRTAFKVVIALLISVLPVAMMPVPAAGEDFPSSIMPIVFVDPKYSFASGGAFINVTVKVFNLTDSVYHTDYRWEPGRELREPGTRFNYSLGNMYGFQVRFSWNPVALEYVEHVVKTPVENYPDGVLHGPLFVVQSDLNKTAGTFSVSQSSWFYPVKSFNCPNRNATILVFTFRILSEEPVLLRLDYVNLIPDPSLVEKLGLTLAAIPLLALDGAFIPEDTARITALETGASGGPQLYVPAILGENVSVRFLMSNEGSALDFYNLTLYRDGDVVLRSWFNESLTSGKSAAYNFTFNTTGLTPGLHATAVKASILHRGTSIVSTLADNFILIQAPSLNVESSNSNVYENETVVLSAIESPDQDPNTEIRDYSWLFYEPGALAPAYEYEGRTVTHTFAKNGTWKIVLTVEDNWRISYDPTRNATASYMKEVFLDVQDGEKPQDASGPTLEQVLLVAALALFLSLFAVTQFVNRKPVKPQTNLL
jgi:hypothetical protein